MKGLLKLVTVTALAFAWGVWIVHVVVDHTAGPFTLNGLAVLGIGVVAPIVAINLLLEPRRWP